MADLVEDFGQVTARLPLQDDGRGEELQVQVRHALGQVVERFFQRHAEVLFFEDAAEFVADRVGISSATRLKPAARLWPARKARAISSSASGSCAANFFSRRLRRNSSHMNGRNARNAAINGAEHDVEAGHGGQHQRRRTARPPQIIRNFGIGSDTSACSNSSRRFKYRETNFSTAAGAVAAHRGEQLVVLSGVGLRPAFLPPVSTLEPVFDFGFAVAAHDERQRADRGGDADEDSDVDDDR